MQYELGVERRLRVKRGAKGEREKMRLAGNRKKSLCLNAKRPVNLSPAVQ